MNIVVKTDTMTPVLQDMIHKLEDPQPALQKIGDDISSMAKDAFSNASFRPEPWAPLKPATLARKAKNKYGSEPLIASGLLSRSPRLIEASPTHALVGSDRRAGDYSLAAIHQLGAPKANIPPRPFFPFGSDGKATSAAIARVKDILLNWLKK